MASGTRNRERKSGRIGMGIYFRCPALNPNIAINIVGLNLAESSESQTEWYTEKSILSTDMDGIIKKLDLIQSSFIF